MSVTARPDQILKAIADDLRTRLSGINAQVSYVRNVEALVERLKVTPQGFRVTLHWAGDSQADSRTVTGTEVLDHQIRVYVDGNLGMGISPDDELADPVRRSEAFLKTLDDLRVIMLAYRFPSANPPNNRLRYGGTQDTVTLPDGVAVAAYETTYNLYAKARQPAEEIDLTWS